MNIVFVEDPLFTVGGARRNILMTADTCTECLLVLGVIVYNDLSTCAIQQGCGTEK